MHVNAAMSIVVHVLLFHYLSHCYTIAWDRLSNQFFIVIFIPILRACLCVYMCNVVMKQLYIVVFVC